MIKMLSLDIFFKNQFNPNKALMQLRHKDLFTGSERIGKYFSKNQKPNNNINVRI